MNEKLEGLKEMRAEVLEKLAKIYEHSDRARQEARNLRDIVNRRVEEEEEKIDAELGNQAKLYDIFLMEAKK